MRNKTEIIEFVKAEMKAKHITKSALGEALGATGVSQMKVQKANNFLSTKSSKINLPDLLIAADLIGVDPTAIILANPKDGNKNGKYKDYEINPSYVVPLLSKKNNTENLVADWLVYPFDQTAYKNIIAVAMPDDSMKPEITKGEILFVDSRVYGFSLTGSLVLVSYHGEFFVGRFKRLKNGQVEISFEDPKKDPLVYSIDNEHLDIIGVVISTFKKIT